MKTPFFPLSEHERAVIYGILKRYPAVFYKRYGFSAKILGLRISPSASVKGIVEDLIGPVPA